MSSLLNNEKAGGRQVSSQPIGPVPASFPAVSVILPIRNEARFIRECLEAVIAQDYQGPLAEIIVIDGMSEDGTQDILTQMSATDSRLRIIHNAARIVPVAMNLGIRQAKGEVLVRVDGHAVVPPDYVRLCVEWLLKEKVECVGGAVESVGTNYVGAAIAAAMSSPFGVGGFSFRTAGEQATPISVETVPFGAFRREVFDRVGFFNEEMVRHQDYEFNYRLRKAGGRILLLPWLRVKYYVRSNLKGLWRQYWGYGLWKGRLLRTYPQSLRLRHLVPPLFVLAVAGSACLAFVSKAGLWCCGALLGTYLLFLIAATTGLAVRGQQRYAPILPLILAILHVSWGMAVWRGLLSGPVSISKGPRDDGTWGKC
jgi:succinoglycan biosynthesis protein ExoA